MSDGNSLGRICYMITLFHRLTWAGNLAPHTEVTTMDQDMKTASLPLPSLRRAK